MCGGGVRGGGMGGGMGTPWHKCGGQKTTCGSWFCLYHVDSRHQTQVIGLGSQCQLSHLIGPVSSLEVVTFRYLS